MDGGIHLLSFQFKACPAIINL